MSILARGFEGAIKKGQESMKQNLDVLSEQNEEIIKNLKEIIKNLNDIMKVLHELCKKAGVKSGLEDEDGNLVDEDLTGVEVLDDKD